MMNQAGRAIAAVSAINEEQPLLAVSGLGKRYGPGCPACLDLQGQRCPQCGSLWACYDISFDLYPGEILGLVGESGSGKSTLLRCLYFEEEATTGIMTIPSYQGGPANLLAASAQQQRYIRNHMMGMVFQNPWLGLRMHVSGGGNIAEKLLAAGVYHVGRIRTRAAELWRQVEMPLPRLDEYPQNFSGGMQQRVQIAKALANKPPLLLLDEVTTGLDLSVQARVLDLVRQIQRELGVAMLLVSHDLAVIRMLADRTMVMHQGRLVEQGLTDQVLEDPEHPYTQLLVRSLL